MGLLQALAIHDRMDESMIGKSIRIMKRLLFRLQKNILGVKYVTARVTDGNLKLPSCSHIAESLFADSFERDQRAAVRRLVGCDDICLDIGANIGAYTILFSTQIIDGNGKVLAFEPCGANFAMLKENVDAHIAAKSVSCFNISIGNSGEDVEIISDPETGGVYNRVATVTEKDREKVGSCITSQMTSIDNALAEYDSENYIFMKIDVEGYQHKVLQGCELTFKRFEDIALLVELNESSSQAYGFSVKATLELLAAAGFRSNQILLGGILKPIGFEDACHMASGRESVDILFIKEGAVYGRRANFYAD
jgi:FkbM family methyltransferase